MKPPNPIDTPAAPLPTGPAVPDFDDGQTDMPSGVEDDAKPRCLSCGGYLAIDQANAPNTCPLCGVLLPPDPAEDADKAWRTMHAAAVRKAAGPLTKPAPKSVARQTAPSAGKGHAWRKDEKFVTMLSEATAKATKAVLAKALQPIRDAISGIGGRVKSHDAAIGDLVERIGRLESALAELMASGSKATDVSMAHRSGKDSVVAEFWRRDGICALRLANGETTEAINGTEEARQLLARFNQMAPK